MATAIRLRRTGARKKPSYRLVVVDSRSPRDGRFIEIVGHYHPLSKANRFQVNKERIQHWLERGAKPSERVQRLLEEAGRKDKQSKKEPESE